MCPLNNARPRSSLRIVNSCSAVTKEAGSCCPALPSRPPGGFLIARAESLGELNEFLADEPYCKAKVMRFSRITEFDPVQHQPILRDWFGK